MRRAGRASARSAVEGRSGEQPVEICPVRRRRTDGADRTRWQSGRHRAHGAVPRGGRCSPALHGARSAVVGLMQVPSPTPFASDDEPSSDPMSIAGPPARATEVGEAVGRAARPTARSSHHHEGGLLARRGHHPRFVAASRAGPQRAAGRLRPAAGAAALAAHDQSHRARLPRSCVRRARSVGVHTSVAPPIASSTAQGGPTQMSSGPNVRLPYSHMSLDVGGRLGVGPSRCGTALMGLPELPKRSAQTACGREGAEDQEPDDGPAPHG